MQTKVYHGSSGVLWYAGEGIPGCQFILRDVLLQGVMAEQIGQHVSGFSNWLITKHAQSYLEAFEGHHEDLVYLTAGRFPHPSPRQHPSSTSTACQTCRPLSLSLLHIYQLSLPLKDTTMALTTL